MADGRCCSHPFLGTARSVLGNAPAVLYMHENQLTYPRSKYDTPDLVYPMMNWSSMAAAEAIWFNSGFHLDAWFDELPEMLGSLPDYRHVDLVEAVADRATVVPVGVDLHRFDPPARRTDDEPPLVLWNHRWEYDKDPEAFFASLRALVAGAVPFRVALAGENFRNDPEEFRIAADELGDRVVQYGFADEAAYRELIRRADVVVSTARQEFFGISVVEAMYAGAVPVLPNRLSYPELVPESVRERCLYRDAAGRDALLRAMLGDPGARAAVRSVLRSEMARFDWSQLAPRYDALLDEVAGRGISRS
jgi:glycosyltransferase involved in cell wall biosynthesis